MKDSIPLEKIGAEKIIWIGQYPSHYVRQMHLDVETARPESIHFIYIVDKATMNKRCYEQGSLPNFSSLLDSNFSIWPFLQRLEKISPKAIIAASYNRRLVAVSLVWSYWNKVRYCFWGDTNLLIVMKQSITVRLIRKMALKFIFSNAYKLLYIGSRNKDYYNWLVGSTIAKDKLDALPYPALLTELPSKNTSDFEKGCEDRKKKFNILYLGRLEPVKGVDKLLKAIILLSPTIRNQIHVNIYGGGSQENELKNLSNKIGINNIVTFHGYVASDQVTRIYQRADLFVLPSDAEPWGLVVNEALINGVPVMCPYWVGAAIDLITDSETGYVLDNNTPETIAAGLERVLHIKEKNKKIGLMGQDRVLNGGWHINAASKRLISIVDELRS